MDSPQQEPYTLPDEFLREIGQVAVQWNYLESILHLCMIVLLGKKLIDGRAHAVFAHMAFPQKLDVMSAMISEFTELPSSAPLSRYKQDIQPLLREAQSKRNDIIHSKWGSTGGQIVRSDIKARGALRFSSTPVTLEEIKEASALMVRAAEVLFNAVVNSADDPNDPPHSGQ